ncbi:MAG: DUF5010 domain-containing protein [Dysgonamonadaceae bacterium]|jgi:hypothetical protein|nr:DUF5010 domain-containing protein [Dysgonamonadaceae bacterium]
MKTIQLITLLTMLLVYPAASAQIQQQPSANNWYVGNTSAGEWIQFKKVWLSAGNYRFTTQAVAGAEGQRVHLELNGERLDGGVSVPTNKNNAFVKVHLGHKTLPEGYYDVKLVFETGGVNCDMIFIRKSNSTSPAVLDDDTNYELTFNDGMHTFAIGGHANSTREMLNGTDPGADAVWKDPKGNLYSRAQVLGWNKQSIYNYNFPYTQETADIYISEQVEAKVEVIFAHGRGEPDNTKQIADRAYKTGPGGAPCGGLTYVIDAIRRNPYARDQIKIAYFADNAPFNLAIRQYLGVEQLVWGNPEHQEFIYNYAVKKFYQTVPRELLFFTPDGKTPMQWWTANSHVSYPSCGYELKEFLEYMVRKVKEDFDLDLALILSTTFFDRDPRTRDIAWGAQGWFSWSNTNVRTEIQTLHGKKFAFALNGGRKPMKDNVLNDWDPLTNHGTFYGDDTHVVANYPDGTPKMRQVYVDGHAQNAEWIVLEAWGDWREGSTWYRSHHPEYAFPNQYISLVREFADRNSGSILLEAEACDEYHTVKAGNWGGAYRLNWYNEPDKEIWDANLEADISIFRPLHHLSETATRQHTAADRNMKQIFAGLRDVWAIDNAHSVYCNEIDGYPVVAWSRLERVQVAADIAMGGNCAWIINTVGTLLKANLPNNQNCNNTSAWEVKNSGVKITDIDGSQSMLWGIDENNKVYYRDYEGINDWTQVNGALTSIAADESFVWGFNPEGEIVRLPAQNRQTWKTIPNPHNLIKLSAGNYEVWGINAQNQVYRISSSGYGEWQHVADGYADVSVGIDYVWLLNPSGVPYKYELGGFQNLTVFNPDNLTTGNPEKIYQANSIVVKENPFRESLLMEISASADDRVAIRLDGLDGKRHVFRNAALQAGTHTLSIDHLGGLSRGVYILSIQGRTQNTKIKVIKK